MLLLTALTTLSLDLPGSISHTAAAQPLPLHASGLKTLLLVNRPHPGLEGYNFSARQPHHLSQLTGVVPFLLRSFGFACRLRSFVPLRSCCCVNFMSRYDQVIKAAME